MRAPSPLSMAAMMSVAMLSAASADELVNEESLVGCWTKDPTAAELEDWSKRKVILPGEHEALILGEDPDTGRQLLEMVPSDHLCIEKGQRFSSVSFAGDEGLGSSGIFKLEPPNILFVAESTDGWFFGRERVLCEVSIEDKRMRLNGCVGVDVSYSPSPTEQEHFDNVSLTRDATND